MCERLSGACLWERYVCIGVMCGSRMFVCMWQRGLYSFIVCECVGRVCCVAFTWVKGIGRAVKGYIVKVCVSERCMGKCRG